MQANGRLVGLPDGAINVDQAGGGGQGYPHQHRQQAPRQGESHVAVVGQQHHRQHRQSHHRHRIGPQQKTEADVAQGDPCQGRKQGGPRQPAAQGPHHKRSPGLNQARGQAGHQAGLPGEAHRLSFR